MAESSIWFSHEEPAAINEWPSLSQFIAEAINDGNWQEENMPVPNYLKDNAINENRRKTKIVEEETA